MAGTLFVVSTPIGNLDDITLRALTTLKAVSVIAAEDTRHTKKLLARFGVQTPLTSYFEHNEREKAKALIKRLQNGESIALVSDAGTPGISDPGYRLVRLAVASDIKVVAIPGPSAVMAGLCISGLPTDEFVFKGFVPAREGARLGFFAEMKAAPNTYVIYESARRLKASLSAMLGVIGDADTVVCREMTKVHEEIIRGSVGSVLEAVKDREMLGEITLIIRVEKETKRPDNEALTRLIRKHLERGESLKDLTRAVSLATGVGRGEIYKEALRIKGEKG